MTEEDRIKMELELEELNQTFANSEPYMGKAKDHGDQEKLIKAKYGYS